jgi:hypothetical protein
VLDPTQVSRWLCELDANGCLGVGFGGGEPTLYRHLTELCDFAAEWTRMAISLTTHAHRLDDRLLAAIAGKVHFIRVSVDGVGATYELIRGRSFQQLRQRIERLRRLVPFGINFVVNRLTIQDLDAVAAFAFDLGAAELLLPEQPHRNGEGVDECTLAHMRGWVHLYKGLVPLSVSTAGAAGLPACDPSPAEVGLRAYAHIDATGVLKRSSHDTLGVRIGSDGVLPAIRALEQNSEGFHQ